jgi:hypothetical protein
MAIFIFLLGLFLFLHSDSFAQVYKYVDKKGTICFTDNPPPSLFKQGVTNKEQKPRRGIYEQQRPRSEIKDILQLGQEALKEELAKPPEKQDRHLIQEMGEILYGDVSGPKPKEQKNKTPDNGKVTIKIIHQSQRAKETLARQQQKPTLE